jgi:hypothetical protein
MQPVRGLAADTLVDDPSGARKVRRTVAESQGIVRRRQSAFFTAPSMRQVNVKPSAPCRRQSHIPFR